MQLEPKDNILKQLQELLGGDTGNLNILQHVVDVEIQVEYFEFTQAHEPNPNHEEVLESEPKLYDSLVSDDEKKGLLVDLAFVDQPEAFRILERFSSNAPDELNGWALMALQESKMLLESTFLDEKQVFISTGLGGKGDKLRYFVVLFSLNDLPFTEAQQKLIEGEFNFILKKYDSQLEQIEFQERYATMHALVPLNINVQEPFQAALDECNSLGKFIRSNFIITNVKAFSIEEIEKLLSQPGEREKGEEK